MLSDSFASLHLQLVVLVLHSITKPVVPWPEKAQILILEKDRWSANVTGLPESRLQTCWQQSPTAQQLGMLQYLYSLLLCANAAWLSGCILATSETLAI